MEPFFQDCIEILEQLHSQMEAALSGLPQEALDWNPAAAETNSMAVIAVHTAASERYWIGDVIAREPSGRNREAEFLTQGLSADEISARLANSLTYVHTVLARLSLDHLAETRLHNGKETRVGRALAHTIEHVGLHTGHLQLTRQMWDHAARR